MTSVLLTAFEPYDRWSQNASWLALVELTKQRPDTPKITTRLYPVDFERVRQKLDDDLNAEYDVALHIGQAPGIGRIHLEAIGLNVGGRIEQSPDEYQPLDPDGPTAYRSNLPLGDWARSIREAGIPAAVSYDAGTYLCNAVLYLSMHLSQQRRLKTRSAFVHVPLSPLQVREERHDYASMPSEAVAAALKIILERIAIGDAVA